jgi:SPX domain protein involved in polyphosphate accumulation
MRIEKKYTFSKDNINIIRDQLFGSKFIFRKKYENRIVNSIYLDNEFLENYSDNLDGISKRIKVRIRYYDKIKEIKTKLAKQFYIEIKSKMDQISAKKIYPFKFPKIILKQIDNKLIPYVLKNSPGNLKPFIMNQTYASLGTTYCREYFESKILNVRCTIDTNLKYWKPNMINLIDNKKIHFYETEYCVLEIKFPIDDKKLLNEKFSDFIEFITPSRHSKYAVGCNLIYK